MADSDLLEIYAHCFRENSALPALTDYTSGDTMTYADMARRIARIHLFYEKTGIRPGDHIALMGRNTPTWVLMFMATVTYGAVIVPILQDFSPNDAMHIINHSDARMLMVSDTIWETLEFERMPGIRAVLSLDTRRIIAERDAGRINAEKVIRNLTRNFRRRYPQGFSPDDISYPRRPKDSVAVINYTSGTTGFSKGVMLTLDNLAGNVEFGINSGLHYRGSRALSFLPLAHAYGCAFDMLTPLATGSHVTLLGRLPSPQILIKAMKEVKPHLIICVPLVFEKIYRKQIAPMLQKRSVSWALALPLIDKAIYSQIRRKLVDAFGGEFEEVIVGGAPLNATVEDFLHKIGFPFTVGYGMTECGPLISYTPWRQFRTGSAGRTLPCMESKIGRPEGAGDGEPGEICVRGQNRMKGYYKNPEATAAVIDADGWLHTGDMGTRDADGTLFIKGRYKTMILSANGQNIYPEEIEAKLNNMPYVAESLVIDRDGRLTALVYPDYEALDADGIGESRLPELMEQVRAELNKQLGAYERIDRIQLQPNEFEKTPKRSIKRFMYK